MFSLHAVISFIRLFIISGAHMIILTTQGKGDAHQGSNYSSSEAPLLGFFLLGISQRNRTNT